MNDKHEWTCKAKFRFPQSMIDEKCPEFMEKTQCSRNKKKARQLACMDLLKSLYLQYPEVWMSYKIYSEYKGLRLPPSNKKKDQDEIDLINKPVNYET